MPTPLPHAASLAACLVLGSLAAAMWFAGRRRLAGTTLLAAWNWTLLAAAAVVGAELVAGWPGRDGSAAWIEPLRYSAAMTTFCPIMAMLGAKRPQYRAWQFIVASLLIVLLMPTAEQMLFRPGQPLYVPAAWSWLMLVLLLLSLLDYIATRFWPSAVLAVAGQTLLVAEYLPLLNAASPGTWPTAGVVCLTAAAALVCWGFPRRRHAKQPWDRVWTDFRDAFGAVWALRVAERLNAGARRRGWNVEIGWRGLVEKPQSERPAKSAPDGVPPATARSLQAILCRFVSSDWIAQRLQEP